MENQRIFYRQELEEVSTIILEIEKRLEIFRFYLYRTLIKIVLLSITFFLFFYYQREIYDVLEFIFDKVYAFAFLIRLILILIYIWLVLPEVFKYLSFFSKFTKGKEILSKLKKDRSNLSRFI